MDDDLYATETFGPIVGVASFETFDEAMDARERPRLRPVAAASTRRDPLHAFRFRERITAGMVSVNNSTSGAEAHLPFGGNGKSGNGSRQSGIWVLDQFTRWQAMNWDYSGRLQKAQMDVADIDADLGLPTRGLTGDVRATDSATASGVGEPAPPAPACSAARSFACCTSVLRQVELGLVRAEVAGRQRRVGGREMLQRLAEQLRDLLVDRPPAGGSAAPASGSSARPVVEAANASDRLSPTPTVSPFTTMTRFSSGIELSWFDRTYTGCTYSNESLIGITRKSPNTTVEPPEPSSVRCAENTGSWLICANTCVGPSMLRPLGNVYAMSLPVGAGIGVRRHPRRPCSAGPRGVNGRISMKCSSVSPGSRISE